MTQSQWIRRVIKPAAFVVCLSPAVLIVWDGFSGGLGANPIEEVTHRTGITTITLLMVTLAVTPARALLGVSSLVLLRRMFGLFAFFYVACHFGIYLFDQFFSLEFIVEDIVERPYITVGFTSFALLIPLAVTSTSGWVKRLGGRRWQQLHRLVYVAAAGGVVHFLWKVKAEEQRPVVYGLVLVALLGFRLWTIRRARARRLRRRSSVGAPAPSSARNE
jgi:sulfoxide reductase heme-binding subunit YedZ